MYVITHKNFDTSLLPKGYKPILVGAYFHENSYGFLEDDNGDNISKWNKQFSELTGLYWLWKHNKDNYVGLSHYRRYFSEDGRSKMPVIGNKPSPMSLTKLNENLNGFDWIIPKKENIGHGNVWQQFADSHHIKDLEITERVIHEKTPEYDEAFKKIMHGDELAPYNMFYTSAERMNEYAKWLFAILFEVRKRVDISQYDRYQQRLFGFLSERLFNVWLLKNEDNKIKYLAVYNTEGDWITVYRKKIINKLKKIKFAK